MAACYNHAVTADSSPTPRLSSRGGSTSPLNDAGQFSPSSSRCEEGSDHQIDGNCRVCCFHLRYSGLAGSHELGQLILRYVLQSTPGTDPFCQCELQLDKLGLLLENGDVLISPLSHASGFSIYD
jgi:hypothetical protein